MVKNWHDYYVSEPQDWYFEFIEEWNTACANDNKERADELAGDALGRGVWVDKDNCWRHPDDPHKTHGLEEILADDWIPY